uniref:Uncharacterized protein n=1 Tax=Arundo donax TaxID=35708 RepID=A0A0A9HFP6_ARUDO
MDLTALPNTQMRLAIATAFVPEL